MPNHVTNKISAEVAQLLASEDRQIDFNRVIPMPVSLHDPDPQQMESRAKAALGMFKEPTGEPESLSDLTDRMELSTTIKGLFKPIERESIGLLIQAIQNIAEYGFAYWYPWAVHNWGTKWNAYEVESDGDFVTFQTAWAHPEPVFLKLSAENPEISIKVEYADEDIGSNCGTVVYKAGAIEQQDIAPNWNTMSDGEKDHWRRFALGLTDPENVEERIAEYALEDDE